MSKPRKEEDQFNVLKNRSDLKKEHQKEQQYKKLFLDVLEKHKGILTSSVDTNTKNTQDYEAEKKILEKIMSIEKEAITGAVVVGLAAFLTVRYLPHLGVRLIGGESKLKALREAEAKARTGPNAKLKSMAGFLFEGTLGFWASYRGYHLAVSMRSDDVYDDIVNLPLVEGKSIVSDHICDEFSDVIRYKVHPAFWKNLDQTNDGAQKLSHEDFFRGVLEFEDSCKKRKAFEKVIRRRDGDGDGDGDSDASDSTSIYIPSPGVPKEITEDEIKAMLQ